MKDELTSLIRERFAGHEAPVDPGAWQAIQAKLSAGAAGGEELQDLFQERFTGHESPVDPSAWANISSQLGHGVAATSGSAFMGGFGWAAAGVGVLALVGAAYLFSAKSVTPDAIVEESVSVIVPEPSGSQEEIVMVPILVETATVEASEPSAIGVVVQPSLLPPAIDPQGAIRPTGPEPSVPTSPQNILPTPGTGTNSTTPEGPAIVESIISQITEQVKAEVESNQNPQGAPDAGSLSDSKPPGEPEEEPEHPIELHHLFLPNNFTPNGDGVNDAYQVSSEGFARMMIRVYSVQNNQLVFSTDSNEPWTGENCIEGYYLVAVEALTKDGRLVTQGSVVWLNRTPVH
jgi:hypothetical protein